MSRQRTLEQWLTLAYGEGEECPPSEVFLEAEWEALTPEERTVVELHVERCPACSAERDLARAFDAAAEESPGTESDLAALLRQLGGAEPAVSEGAKQERERAGRVLRFPSVSRLLSRPALGLAAAAVVVLVAGIVLRTMTAAPPSLPGVPVEGVSRGSRVELVAPVGEVEEIPRELVWSGIEGAVRYQVTVISVDETVLWRETVSAAGVPIPSAFRSTLHSAVVYFWYVEAFDSAGSRIAWSETSPFKVVGGVGAATR